MALFGTEKREGAPSKEEKVVSSRTGGGDLDSLLGKGSEFDGKLTFEGQVRIDGKFSGQILTKDTLTIGPGAKVNADITAGTVIVNGVVEGTIRATSMVELHPPARVKGTIEAPAMSMEKGVIFEGTTKMEAQAAKPAGAPPPSPGTK
ncbi:MAG: polymer-forming cytoskeletal protein [Myxococcales bacterium]|nr:polymer-forming cytoskeletal protein [Myxococcales bacterium]